MRRMTRNGTQGKIGEADPDLRKEDRETERSLKNVEREVTPVITEEHEADLETDTGGREAEADQWRRGDAGTEAGPGPGLVIEEDNQNDSVMNY